VINDLRHAWRAIRRAPILAAVVVVSLGIGIGVNTTVFSWVQAIVLRPLPGVEDVASYHLVEPLSEGGTHPGVSWPEYLDLRARLTALPQLIAYRMTPFTIGAADHAERSYGLLVSGNYFQGLGLRPALGRFLREDEVARAGGAPVVVISHGYWETRFASNGDVIGQTLRVNERPLTIVGVAPAGFQGTVLGLDFDLWVPATMAPVLLGASRELEDRGSRGYAVMGRLPPHTSLARAQGETDAAMRDLAVRYPESNAGVRAEVRPFWRAPRGPQLMLARALLIPGATLLSKLGCQLVHLNSTPNGTFNCATLAINSGNFFLINSSSDSGTSSTNSSCTCITISVCMRSASSQFCTAIIDNLIKSAAVPCIGALIAARSAPWRRGPFGELISGSHKRRPNTVST